MLTLEHPPTYTVGKRGAIYDETFEGFGFFNFLVEGFELSCRRFSKLSHFSKRILLEHVSIKIAQFKGSKL